MKQSTLIVELCCHALTAGLCCDPPTRWQWTTRATQGRDLQACAACSPKPFLCMHEANKQQTALMCDLIVYGRQVLCHATQGRRQMPPWPQHTSAASKPTAHAGSGLQMRHAHFQHQHSHSQCCAGNKACAMHYSAPLRLPPWCAIPQHVKGVPVPNALPAAESPVKQVCWDDVVRALHTYIHTHTHTWPWIEVW